MIDPTRLTAICDWLTAGALTPETLDGVTGEISRRLVAAGMPLALFGIDTPYLIDPNVMGNGITWTPRRGVQAASSAAMPT